jgi:GT2 family glycosyltransferase
LKVRETFSTKTAMYGMSIIIPVEGRVKLIEQLLESLRKSHLPDATIIEIIVVDSSEIPDAQAIKEACKQYDAAYYYGSKSVRAKRNMGEHKACHEYLLFLDSDCTVSESLISCYLNYIKREAPRQKVIAGAGPTIFQGGESWFTRLIEKSNLLTPFKAPKSEKILLWSTTSNLMVSKAAFKYVGGFREDLPFRLGGDDTDFCLRLYEAGCRIAAIPDAVCYHSWTTWSSPISVVRRSFRWGWVQAIILKRHPRFRRIAAPGMPVYFLFCFFAALLATALGFYIGLMAPIVFLLTTIIIHALLVAIYSTTPVRKFLNDIVLAFIECPFGFGKLLGSLSNWCLSGILYRLGIDDSEADAEFPEMVNDLWSNNIAIVVTIIFITLVSNI